MKYGDLQRLVHKRSHHGNDIIHSNLLKIFISKTCSRMHNDEMHSFSFIQPVYISCIKAYFVGRLSGYVGFKFIINEPYSKQPRVLTLIKPWFLRVCSTSLLKTLWEKEKLLVTSNFSCSHSVFYLSGELSAIFIKFEIVVCKLFQFGRV